MTGRRRPVIDGMRSSSHLGLHVGADWSVTCHVYPNRSPILAVRLGLTSFSLSPAGNAVTSDHIDFAYALIAAVNDYLMECERIRFDTGESSAGPLAA
ncbi:conserved hypothetical protein [Frankia canadensis]|uniref:Uncharacterized protein n=1 Tax=Frankia canadensis TaxID=1836972 RepID=A0A2I2L146_9ACTN|nr:hypothetical protein [Frankia canadensis]SNQ51652.1 conserved hypothetical protein [Frankia canadensis]SOU58942.1 conserved hypothetical protein [Frankia canadensis]